MQSEEPSDFERRAMAKIPAQADELVSVLDWILDRISKAGSAEFRFVKPCGFIFSSQATLLAYCPEGRPRRNNRGLPRAEVRATGLLILKAKAW